MQIVERRVQVPAPQPLTRRDWPRALAELAAQLDDGRIYDRDLAGLSIALDAVLAAYHSRYPVGPAPPQGTVPPGASEVDLADTVVPPR